MRRGRCSETTELRPIVVSNGPALLVLVVLLCEPEQRLEAAVLPPLGRLEQSQKVKLMERPHEPRLDLLPSTLDGALACPTLEDRRKALKPVVQVDELARLEVPQEEDRRVGQGLGEGC